jgi:hypothetical protein
MSASDELAALEFQAAVFSVGQGHSKSLETVIRLLRSDHPLSAQDKSVLADFLENTKAMTTRGRPPERMFSPTWRLRKAVSEICQLRERDPRLTMDRAMEVVLFGYQFQGRAFDREQILRELKRAKKPKKISNK